MTVALIFPYVFNFDGLTSRPSLSTPLDRLCQGTINVYICRVPSACRRETCTGRRHDRNRNRPITAAEKSGLFLASQMRRAERALAPTADEADTKRGSKNCVKASAR